MYVRNGTAAPGRFDLPDDQLCDDLTGAWKLDGTTPLTQCKVELEIACRINGDDIDAWTISA